MPGSSVVFTPDRAMPRAGVGVAYENTGDLTNPVALGVVGAAFKADWGPYTVKKLYSSRDVDLFYGTTNNTDTARQAFIGGAGQVLSVRPRGTGAAPATATLVDSTLVAPPAGAPTVAAAAGGAVTAGTYNVGYTFFNSFGETTISPTAPVTTATTNLTVNVSALPALPTGATGMNIYMSQAGPGAVLYKANSAPVTTTTTTITAVPAITNAQPPAINTAFASVTTGTVSAKYDGARGNSLSLKIRTPLTPASSPYREALVLEGTIIRETFTFLVAGDQTVNLAAAVNNTGSDFISVVASAPGNSILAANTFNLSGGVNPTSALSDYVTALGLLEAYDQNLTVTDDEAATNLPTYISWVDRVRNEGMRTMFVFAELTSVPYGDSTTVGSRMYNSFNANDLAVVYVGNGFVDLSGVIIQGHTAAARVAGMIAGSRVTDSMTHAAVYQAVKVTTDANADVPTYNRILEAYNDGAVIFTVNSRGQVQIEYGVTTFRIANKQYDSGWSKIRRVRTRDNLVSRVVSMWEPQVGRVNNTADGRLGLQAQAQTVINQMVNEGALISGTVVVSTRFPPAGDTVIFEASVDDADAAEKIGVIFGFRFSVPTAPVR